MRYLLTLTLLTCGAIQAQDTISADEYWQFAFALVDDHIAMDDEGVFLNDDELKVLQGYKFPTDGILGTNEPGGFYERPPGSDWLRRLERFQNLDVAGGPRAKCTEIPPLLIDREVCAFEVVQLYASWNDFDLAEKTIALFHLARICREAPQACEPYIQE